MEVRRAGEGSRCVIERCCDLSHALLRWWGWWPTLYPIVANTPTRLPWWKWVLEVKRTRWSWERTGGKRGRE